VSSQRRPAAKAGSAEGLAAEVGQAISRFVAWLDRVGYASFDPYDIWGTRYGLWARRVYYRRAWLGAPLVVPVVLLEVLAPGLRRLLVRKARYATADAQLVLAFLNLHRMGFPVPRSSVLSPPSSDSPSSEVPAPSSEPPAPFSSALTPALSPLRGEGGGRGSAELPPSVPPGSGEGSGEVRVEPSSDPGAPCSEDSFRRLTAAATNTPLTPALSLLRGEGGGRGSAELSLSAPPGRGEGSGEVRADAGHQPPASSSQTQAPCPEASFRRLMAAPTDSLPHAPSSTPHAPCSPPSSDSWLARARSLAEELLASSIPGYRGYCWGYPFDWQNNKGLWPKQTPFITCTPYVFEAFLGLHEATGEVRYRDIAASIARFVAEDLHDTPTGPEAAAASYSPQDQSAVVNASAYRAFVLFEAAHRFGNDGFRVKAWRNLNFVLQSQRPDGSWLYATDNPAEAFIDHFHTCFVLKNLVKLNRRLREPRVREAIERGYNYYKQALFDPSGNPKPFAVRPRLQLVRLELYDVAEAITLGVLLRDQIPEAFDRACVLGRRLISDWQLADGHFVTRVYRGGLRHTLPFLRWPQAQLFYALTNLLVAVSATGQTRRVGARGSD